VRADIETATTSITSDYILPTVPIDIEQFEESSTDELRASGRTNAEEILTHLAANPEKAFTPKEIHEATGVARGSVGVVLSRLGERDLVRHRGEYWAIADTEDVAKTVSAMETARSATERFGPEDPAEWGPGVDGDE
jgi:hypothetical protein